MKNFTFKDVQVGKGLSAQSSFKSFVVMVVMLIMTASSAMAQEAKFEVIYTDYMCYQSPNRISPGL
jgi:hypothetical protein